MMKREHGEQRIASLYCSFAVLALVSIVAGLIVHLFHASLGVDRVTARLIATGFLVAGALDVGVLLIWERLFGRS